MAGVLNNYGVSNVQQKLIDAGYDPGPTDNLWGPRTAAAVRKFQTDKGLTVDEIVGPQTWGALNQPKPQPTPQAPQPVAQPAQPTTPQDPMLAIIGNDPEAMAMYQQAQLAAKKGSQNAMETLNSRGILNSTITADRVAQTEQEAMAGANVNIMGLLEQRKQQKVQEAYNRLNLLGYADNEVAKVLGVPVGTPTAAVKQQEAQMQLERERMAASERQAAASRAASAAAAPKAPSASELKAQQQAEVQRATQWAYKTIDEFALDPNTDAEEILNFIRRNARDFAGKGIDVADLLKRAELLYNDEFFRARTDSYINEKGEVPW